MGKFTRKGILIEEFGLSGQDFFDSTKEGHTITIVRRAGMEKIAEAIDAKFFGLKVSGIDTKMGPIFTATIRAKRRIKIEGKSERWSDTVNRCASASPQNCLYDRFSEIAENRVKHRAILALAGLSMLNVHSVDEAKDFMNMSRLDFKKDNDKKPDDGQKKQQEPVPKSAQSDKKKEIEDAMKQINKSDKMKKSLRGKMAKVRENRKLLE